MNDSPACITPALTPEDWCEVRGAPTGAIGRVVFKGHRLPGIAGVQSLEVDAAAEMPALIALANASLPDSDPRKITREMVKAMHDRAEAHLDRNDDMNWNSSEVKWAKQLRGIADALASYLPPEALDNDT